VTPDDLLDVLSKDKTDFDEDILRPLSVVVSGGSIGQMAHPHEPLIGIQDHPISPSNVITLAYVHT
jgi:hypothetical protein